LVNLSGEIQRMKPIKIWSIVLTILALSGLIVSATAFAAAGSEAPKPPTTVQVGETVSPKLSPVMRDVEYVPPVRKLDREEINPMKNPGLFLPDLGLTGTDTKYRDPLAARGVSTLDAPDPILNFEGQGDFNMYAPPDTTGDVGPNHFVQMVNVNTAVYDKSGNLLAEWANNQLWDGFGGPCENDNSGDPIVLYDDMADRWVLTQFAIESGQHQCFAISTTPDPLGSYYLYAYQTPDFPDYPKIGVWTDGYYMGTNSGYPNAYYAHAFDRQAMLAGDPAGYQYAGGYANFLMPADADGQTPPPAGDPGIFYTFYDEGYPNHPAGTFDRLALYEFDVDWDTPANSTFTLSQELEIAEFNYTTCGFFNRDCIPQPGTGMHLDAVDPWPMVRLQYRNLNTYQAMVGNFTTDVDGTDHAGIRWFELRKGGLGWDIYQEGTWAPDEHHRFMGSIAMDGSGNIALGYSIASATLYPSIRYTVHANGDALGTMQNEAELMAGGGSQTGLQRWGDYSATVVDPTDNCTFWITNEYHDVTDPGYSWNTRIGTFRIPGCTGSTGYVGTLNGTVTNANTSAPIENADIVATLSITQSFAATTDVNGEYEALLPVGEYTVAASAFGYQPASVSSVEVISGEVTTQDFALTPANWYTVEGIVTDANTGWPLYATIDIDGYPGDAIWTDPLDGSYSISLPEGIAYTFHVSAFVDGYLAESADVGPLTGNTTQDFALGVDDAACMAPGYAITTGSTIYTQDFDANNGGYAVSGFTSWAWGMPTSGPYSAHSGSYVWATNLSGNYSNGEDGYITSPAIDLSSYAGSSFEISWWQWLSTEEGWDYASVEVSNDGGATWTRVYGEVSGAVALAWTEESAVVGSDYAVSNFHLRFRLRSDTSITAPGFYVDDVSITTLSCVTPTGGLVIGNVYDGNTNDPLLGALVAGEDGNSATTVATPDDPAVDDGFYVLYAETSEDVTASMDEYVSATEAVSVVAGDAVNQDFYLGAGWIEADPAALHVTLDMGDTSTVPLDLNNLGVADAAFEIKEAGEGFIPMLKPISIPAFTGELPASKVPTSMFRAPNAPQLSGDAASLLLPLAGEPAFAMDIYPGENLVYIPDTTAPGTWNVIGNIAGSTFFAGDFVGGDFSTLYVLNYNDSTLYAVDTATAGVTAIGPATPNGGETWSGATGAADGTFFAAATTCGASTLYTVDVATGDVTEIGAITNGPCIMDIAINAEGELYGVDIADDNLVQIDPATGAGTVVGSLGVSANYAQGMDFEEETGVLYWAAYTTQGELRVIDTTTGASALVGAFPGGAEVDALAFATGGAATDIPWLSESPITGTVAALDSQTIDVTFDASIPEITQPGDYQATLRITTDTPYDDPTIPVTMTVVPPATYGRVAGTVTGLGYCDDDPAAIEGAQVVVVGATKTITVTTDAAGYYVVWMDESEAPVTIYVTADEHESGMEAGVDINAGEITPVDFDLRWLEPCLSLDATGLDVTLDWGQTETLSITLTNDGAAEADFEFKEQDNGLLPAFRYPSIIAAGVNGTSFKSENLKPVGSNVTVPQAPARYAGPDDLVFYGDRTAFTDDYPDLTQEDFEDTLVSDGDVIGCAGPFDEFTDNACFAPGAIVPGLSIWTANPNGTDELATLGDGFLGLPSAMVGPMYFTDDGIISFTGDDEVFVVGFDVYAPMADATFTVSIYGPDDELLGQTTVAADADGTFFGVSAASPIAYIVTDTGGGNDGELFDDIVFGSAAAGLPWLAEAPITGTVAADSSEVIDVIFDAGVPEIVQPGSYLGTLKVKSNDPGGTLAIPVTMTVVAPPTYTELNGTVTSLGYCDDYPVGLEGAQVVVVTASRTYTLTTDADGAYVLWLDVSQAPLSIYVTADEHTQAMQTGVPLTLGEATTVDFALRWLKPCVAVSPAGLEVFLPTGYTQTLPLDLENAGAALGNFAIREQPIAGLLANPTDGEDVLVVDDGDNPSATAIETSLTNLGYTWVEVDAATFGSMLVDDLLQYRAVLIAGGWGITTYDAEMMAYLDAGGSLFITDNDLGYQYFSGGTFYNDYLQATYISDDPYIDELRGEDIMAGINPNISGDPYPDDFAIGAEGVEIFQFSGGDSAGVLVDRNGYKAIYLSWEFEYTGADADAIIAAVMDVFAPTSSDIPWLSEDPITGTIAADGAQIIDVTFDTLTYTVGTYNGLLEVETDDPMAPLWGIPVTMTVVETPTYGVELTPATHTLTAMPGETVTYTMHLHNMGNTTNTFDLTHSGNVWGMEMPVTSFTLNPDEGVDFHVVVHIPAHAGGETDVATITATGAGGASDSAVLTTHAMATYGVEVTPITATLSAMPGETVTYTLHVSNTGNTANTFAFTATGNAWMVDLPGALTLPAGAGADVHVTVHIPADAGGEIDVATITATGAGGASASSVLTTHAGETFGVEVTPITATLTAAPGETVTYTLHVVNLGNTENTFTLAATDNDWTVDLPAPVTLGAGEATDVHVTVHIPAGSAGESDVATITVSGAGGASDSAVLTTHSVQTSYQVFLPIIFR
jgi:uncharacterized membrane protein